MIAYAPSSLPARVLLLGAGELGKELTISLKRLGCLVVACDSYVGAPAMQVADEARIFDMTDPRALAADTVAPGLREATARLGSLQAAVGELLRRRRARPFHDSRV